MSKAIVIALVVLLLGSITICGLGGVAAVLFLRGPLFSDGTPVISNAPPSPEIVVQTAVPTPTLEQASLPTLPSADDGLLTDGWAQSVEFSDYTALYKQVEPAVVAILAYVQQMGQLGSGSGSGFVIDESGIIVTNEHVIADAVRVEVVYFDGTAAEATILGSDVDSDLAVLKVDQLPDNVAVLPLGDSDDVEPGQPVVAIGNPFGLQNTITSGIVSAVGRMIPARIGAFSIPQAIQTDAAINPGNSGGPLINVNGEVIGVNAQIVSGGGTAANAGIGFAIPVNIVRMVVPYLSEGREYPWPWIGISGTDLNLLIAEAGSLDVQRGAYVADVTPGGPAAIAGLRGSTGVRQFGSMSVPVGGDVIVGIDGDPVYDFADLLEHVAFGKPGDEVELVVFRDGREIEITVELEQRPAR